MIGICSKITNSRNRLRLKISIYSDSTKKRRDSTRSIFSCNLPFAGTNTGPILLFGVNVVNGIISN